VFFEEVLDMLTVLGDGIHRDLGLFANFLFQGRV
jgi:hypothetical protein